MSVVSCIINANINPVLAIVKVVLSLSLCNADIIIFLDKLFICEKLWQEFQFEAQNIPDNKNQNRFGGRFTKNLSCFGRAW